MSAVSNVDDFLPTRGEMDKIFDLLVDQIQNNHHNDESSTDTTIPSCLLQLKGIHRQLYGNIQSAEATYNKKVSQIRKRLRNKEAVQYERKQLEHRIDLLKTFSTPHLIQLARDEEESGVVATTAVAVEDDHPKKKTDAEILRDYFSGRDISIPDDRTAILQRLHDEINARGKLEQTIKTKQGQLTKLLKEVKTVTQQLTSIPQHVAAIERASLPLQKLLPESLVGTDRKYRFEQAQSLPAPLYVLLQQLQQVVDDDRDEKTRPTLSVVDKNQVLLQLPFPDPSASQVSTSSKAHSKKAAIQFMYDDLANMVTASSSGCNALLLHDVLLHELFPGDTPPSIPNQRGLPYHWCNYMAGLHRLPPTQQVSSFVSTRVIVAELKRRVRANATLHSALQAFQRGNVPTIPDYAMASLPFTTPAGESLECKLVKFESVQDDAPLAGEYMATIVKNGESLKACVRIHMARYPATPPVWTLTPVMESIPIAGDVFPCYDASLAELERRVNVELLEQIAQDSSSLPQLYDWILVLQLREIMSVWPTKTAQSSTGRKRKIKD